MLSSDVVVKEITLADVLDGINARFDKLEAQTNERFDKLEARVSRIESRTAEIRTDVQVIATRQEILGWGIPVLVALAGAMIACAPLIRKVWEALKPSPSVKELEARIAELDAKLTSLTKKQWKK